MTSSITKLQFTTMVSKRFFVMLILIILGKNSVKEENIHLYLASLIEELQRLWKGVKTIDGSVLEKAHSSVESIYSTNSNFNF